MVGCLVTMREAFLIQTLTDTLRTLTEVRARAAKTEAQADMAIAILERFVTLAEARKL